jgi:hypothetical protein
MVATFLNFSPKGDGGDSRKQDFPKVAPFFCTNFARIHQTLRVAPAMEAGVADHVWSLEEITWLLN